MLQPLPNESARQSDGTFVQFYGELGGPKGSLPELDQALASKERWEPPQQPELQPPPPPPPRTAAAHRWCWCCYLVTTTITTW